MCKSRLIVLSLFFLVSVVHGDNRYPWRNNPQVPVQSTQTRVKERFSDVAVPEEVKEDLRDIIQYLKNPEKFSRMGVKVPRGVLLVGEPGNGKTLLARALAGEANCPFFSASGSEFIEMFVGVGARRVRDLFAKAKAQAPAIIFIDEIDSVGGKRTSFGGAATEYAQTLNQLLTEMDGFKAQEKPVIVIAATNRVDMLDSALLRPGRFDRQVHVPYPALEMREAILKVHARDKKLAPSVRLHDVARTTTGCSGAQLANLLNEAGLHALNHNRDSITREDIEEACDRMFLGKKQSTIKQSPEELKMTAYHESGHALVRLLSKNVDPLYKLTILPRGNALGVTFFVPERDRYGHTKDEMIAQIKSLLGGRIAEEIVFNALTTGASNDFKKATEIAYAMVCRYGMSRMGPIVYDLLRGGCAEETRRKIDQEVQYILNTAYAETKQLLVKNRAKLDKLALTLLKKETMYAEEVYTLLNIKR